MSDSHDASAVLHRILTTIEEYVYVDELLPDGRYVVRFAGPCRGLFLGLPEDEALGVTWRDHVHDDDRELFDAVHQTVLTLGRLDVEYRVVGADGACRWVRDRGQIREVDGKCFLEGSVIDTTEAHALQQRLISARAEANALASTDALTGLANRRALDQVAVLARGEALGYVHLDVDRFKRVNDQLGHAAGDAVLQVVGARLREAIRHEDIAIRLGGEEFLLVLRGIHTTTHLRQRADDLAEQFRSRPVHVDGNDVPITISIGAVLVGPGTTAVDDVLRLTDRAMYQAKDDGRDRAVVLRGFSPG